MPLAAQISEVGDSVAIKVSGKNQVTIPSAARKKYDFGDYALCTFTEDGILIQPLDPADNSEDLTVRLLRHLIDEGYEGDMLLEKYEELKPKFLDFAGKVLDAEQSVAEGRTTTYATVRKNLKDKYGL
ncbi:MAG: AbrB/MazE/SpoVT family DNA-binding domain-containing protein [Eggerthellaceae bacterium]|nr:AbrB/MazE/SpoVT family DNA-binding domain-containing protein [Eggerthellaceae bacterium]